MQDPFASAPADDEAQSGTSGAHDYSDGPPVETPFNPPPAEPPPAAPVKKAAPKKAAPKVEVAPTAEGKHVMTFKGGTGFDAPWYVVHASGLDEVEELLSGDDAARFAKVLERVQKVAAHFAGLAPAPAAAPQRPARQAAPQEAQGAPGGEKRFCSHGEMRFKSGIGKSSGKPYQAFFCPSGDRNDECKAQFLR